MLYRRFSRKRRRFNHPHGMIYCNIIDRQAKFDVVVRGNPIDRNAGKTMRRTFSWLWSEIGVFVFFPALFGRKVPLCWVGMLNEL